MRWPSLRASALLLTGVALGTGGAWLGAPLWREAVMRAGELAIYSSPTTVTARIHVEGGFAEVNEKGLTVLAEQAAEA